MNIGFNDFREEWLSDVREGNPSTVELGYRFARKLLTQWLDIDDSSADSSDDIVYCDGCSDGGIDIAYLARAETLTDETTDPLREGDTWYLVQSKYGTAFQGTDTILQEGQKVISTLAGLRTRVNSTVENVLERLTVFRQQASANDRIVLMIATEDDLTTEQKAALADVRTIGRERLGSLFDVEHASIANIYQRLSTTSAPDEPGVQVRLEANLVKCGNDLLVGSIPLLALYTFLKGYRTETEDLDQLYEKNVRRFLGSRRKVNKAMQETIENSPEHFGLYNNGITIVVKDFESADADGAYLLKDPYIVNGCQTSKTIWTVCHNKLEAGGTGASESLEQWKSRVAEAVVVAKVVRVGPHGDNLLQNITRYTNSQNAVSEKDFLTLTNDFHRWASEMAQQHSIFLEVQRGGWDSQKAAQRQRPSGRQFNEWANAFDLLKVYGAGWLGEPGTAYGRNAAFVPGGSIFKRIVGQNGSELVFGVDDLYATYIVQSAANQIGFGRRTAEQSRRQTRFLFYRVLMELLKQLVLRAGAEGTPKDLTAAVITLGKPENEDKFHLLVNEAVQLIADYMTRGFDESIFNEPALQDTFNSDLNAILKWEKLGKGPEHTPMLHKLISVVHQSLGRARAGETSPRDQILTALKE